MCGIFFSLNISDFVPPEIDTYNLLRNRGPDCVRHHKLRLPYQSSGSEADSPEEPTSLFLSFISTVLDLRGDHIQPQPIVDTESESILCWNGEAWKIFGEPVRGNDAHRVFESVVEALNPSPSDENKGAPYLSKEQTFQQLANVMSGVSGPYSFLLYDGFHSRIIYGRDPLGRRSLLRGWDESGTFKICSVCDGTSSNHYDEVETDGLHVIELADSFRDFTSSIGAAGVTSHHAPKIETIPWGAGNGTSGSYSLGNPIPPMNQAVPEATAAELTPASPSVASLEENLRKSLALRVKNIAKPPFYDAKSGAKLAVLFSGGLDCTVLAKLSHELLPIDEPIDLLNVAFENPRRVAAAEAASTNSKDKDETNTPVSAYEECPDRITGRSSLAELQDTCPNRTWRFISINIPYTETLKHRDQIKRLMRPHNTEMDLSIACALFFAARGQGEIPTPDSTGHTTPYTTTARVLLSGLGADELFAGYTRHTLAFTREGFPGLIAEINLDVTRLGKRNLGRDDRIISNWGREVRFPYLDEEFLSWALRLPVWEKCGFSNSPTATGEGEPDLEPNKKILRLLAWKLGMENVSREKKRAIQFGARTAKMECGSGRCNGTDVLV